jgi:hypothetical protein
LDVAVFLVCDEVERCSRRCSVDVDIKILRQPLKWRGQIEGGGGVKVDVEDVIAKGCVERGVVRSKGIQRGSTGDSLRDGCAVLGKRNVVDGKPVRQL